MSVSSRVCIGQIPVDRITLEDMLRAVSTAITAGSRKTIFYANAHAVTLAESDRDFAGAMQRADTVYCDGIGAYVASRVLGSPIPERFTLPDWIVPLAQACRAQGSSIFFLGGQEGVAAEAARRVQAAVPGVRVFSHHGHFAKDDATSRAVVDLVNKSGAKVLLVGFGMPLQELWINRYRRELAPNVVWAIGAALDFVAGRVRRGPDWLTQNGFEWLTRLIAEPRRLAKRYLIGLPEFAFLVARQKLAGRAALTQSR